MEHEYLLSYGLLGDFGRFRPTRPLLGRRGDRAVIRTHRGLEIGEVLCEARPRHAHFLPNNTLGALLRLSTAEDECRAEELFPQALDFADEAALKARTLGLPLAVLDAELLLDGEHAVLHLVRWEECDIRPLVSGLSMQFSLHVLLQDLTRAEAHEHECGSCGSDGGCGDCGSGGGGCGSCGEKKPKEGQAHFAELREKMLAHNRVPLV
jgi:cell fate regulator YaaT (PSP1 superfamily)